MKKNQVLAVGGVYLDINCPEFPFYENGLAIETETIGRNYILEPGGSSINFARLCHSLNLPSVILGKIGPDIIGSTLRDLLKSEGIIPELIIDNNCTTNISFNMVNPNGKTIMAVAGNANQAFTPEELMEKARKKIENCSFLFLGGGFKLKSLQSAFEELIKYSIQSGTKVVIDHGRLNEDVTHEEKLLTQSFAKLSDYYLPSRGEFLELWNVGSIEEGLRKLEKEARCKIIVKDGDSGVVTLIDGQIVRVPSFKVNPIHTVGAGDSFDAGFITALNKNDSLIDSIKFGCATAALKISKPYLPSKDQVEELINTSDFS